MSNKLDESGGYYCNRYGGVSGQDPGVERF